MTRERRYIIIMIRLLWQSGLSHRVQPQQSTLTSETVPNQMTSSKLLLGNFNFTKKYKPKISYELLGWNKVYARLLQIMLIFGLSFQFLNILI